MDTSKREDLPHKVEIGIPKKSLGPSVSTGQMLLDQVNVFVEGETVKERQKGTEKHPSRKG